MTTFLERYRSGEHEQVWAELSAYGDMTEEKEILADALTVAHETMIRMKRNIEQLIPRLLNLGYQFECPLSSIEPLDYAVYAPPRPDAHERIAELEHFAGSLPLSLRAWYEIVGTVNFIGTNPAWRNFDSGRGWPDVYLDPLVVYPIERCLEWYHDMAGGDETESTHGFEAIIAPDYYHKDHISGGSPYSIRLPATGVDAPVLYEWHDTTFVNYLRICCHWGGFPGFARYKDYPEQDLAYLRDGLLPI